MGLSPNDIFAPFELERARGIVAAVSGGSDSLALLFLLKDYLATLDNPPRLRAVTIDHRLREESRQEAEDVGALCRAHNIEHRILAWNEPKPASGLAAAARSARYRLLVQAAQEAGADYIATGHTQDDQIETFLMRKERSSHVEARGLAAMAARSRLENSVELIRPLLGVPRQRLRKDLIARGVAWVDDPSNVNADYERPRIRLTSAAEADAVRILEQIALAGAARKRDNAVLVAALAHPGCLAFDPCGSILLDADIYAALAENPRRLLSGLLASLAGGRRFLPGDAERSRIERVLCGQEESGRLTVFGALIERGKNGSPHRFRRERRNLPAMRLERGKEIVWDGRFHLTNRGGPAFDVGAPGRQELADFTEARGLVFDAGQREALMVLPALYREGRIVHLLALAAPNLPAKTCEGIHVERHFALFDHVLPGYDFGLAGAVESCLGRKCPNFCKPD
ncbi:tRNA lysidine(34) synthetase TilS [Falsochrobactrum shanghaiense]|uniref:tRNA(Ile)-lysidine synthase n=1 Tax=Falsochrobactrum shanghaiense TaxID=2201899 RepID=A0A316J6T4_9HYPH|nr:tRNA lysidine(34) synthetase TilS [Falsochrobactrum shanghaiense]PWL16888.1 tRNA lysidine(34) synthetase TilS [Falsochrobactrum shanghaiense]